MEHVFKDEEYMIWDDKEKRSLSICTFPTVMNGQSTDPYFSPMFTCRSLYRETRFLPYKYGVWMYNCDIKQLGAIDAAQRLEVRHLKLFLEYDRHEQQWRHVGNRRKHFVSARNLALKSLFPNMTSLMIEVDLGCLSATLKLQSGIYELEELSALPIISLRDLMRKVFGPQMSIRVNLI